LEHYWLPIALLTNVNPGPLPNPDPNKGTWRREGGGSCRRRGWGDD
jgi:hypothetical protein